MVLRCFLTSHRMIYQPLALGNINRTFRSLPTVHVLMLPSEPKLIAVPMQMLLANVVENVMHATFQQAQE